MANAWVKSSDSVNTASIPETLTGVFRDVSNVRAEILFTLFFELVKANLVIGDPTLTS